MQEEQKYWLWVTSRATADASHLVENETETWTCDKETKGGDLALIYL